MEQRQVLPFFANEPYATLRYGNVEYQIGLTLLHTLSHCVADGDGLFKLHEAVKAIEGEMWKDVRRG